MLRGLRGCCVLGRVHLFVFFLFALFMLQTGLYVYLACVFLFFFWGGVLFCLCVGSVCALINEALVRSRPARPHCWFMHRQCIVAVPRTGRRTCFARARVASSLAFVRRVALEAHIGPVSPRNEPSFAPHFKPCYASPNRRQRAAGGSVFIASRIASPLHRPSCSAALCSEC